MPVTPTYPGVYVQEVPSGVRTIVGVSTSIAVFIGRALQGALNDPVLCLNYSDFEREFSSEFAGSDLARAVRLFFQNGGTQCYAVRIADGATFSKVTLKSESKTDVLAMTAKSPGVVGDSLRAAVTYNGLQPEATFNLQFFRWAKNSSGALVKKDSENYTALSMDPKSNRYAQDYVNKNSNLVTLKDKVPALITAGTLTLDSGYSRSGRPLPGGAADFHAAWKQFISGIGPAKKGTPWTGTFNVSSSGTYSGAGQKTYTFTVTTAGTIGTNGVAFSWSDGTAPAKIQTAINDKLATGTQVKVSFAGGPGSTKMLSIASTKGDVFIEPAATADLAVPSMLGTAQGGLEISRYAKCRPAANGIVFNPSALPATPQLGNHISFAGKLQTIFDTLGIGAADIDLSSVIPSVTTSGALMYRDAYSSSTAGNSDGVREKWSLIAAAVNKKKSSDASFKWSAKVWGSRLALIPGEGGDNSQGTLVTILKAGGGTDVGNLFSKNIRYYSFGTLGQGAYQGGGVQGSNGKVPKLADYRQAFEKLDKEVDLFNLMVLPHDEDPAWNAKNLWGPASIFCQKRRAFLLMDAPMDWSTVQKAVDPGSGVNSLRIGLVKDHSALFYPRVVITEKGLNKKVGASGAIAGLMARIDGSRGVWKAPAGTEADLRGVVGLEYRFSDDENGILNPRAINTLRIFPNGIVNWGARTMDGDNDFGSEYKYIPIRRLALYMEESLYRGLKWVVFEPNDEPLWAQIRLNVGAFMHNLFRQGAFQGQKPKDAYFVKCDSETTTQNDRNLGIVNIWVGFAPLKPAEFVILYLQQMAGQIEV